MSTSTIPACPSCGEKHSETKSHCDSKTCGWFVCGQPGCAPKAQNGRDQETVFTIRGGKFYRVK